MTLPEEVRERTTAAMRRLSDARLESAAGRIADDPERYERAYRNEYAAMLGREQLLIELNKEGHNLIAIATALDLTRREAATIIHNDEVGKPSPWRHKLPLE